MKETVVNTRKVEQEIQKVREEIRKLQQFGQKLKVAKSVKMPYYKFRNIMKHGLVSMENEDREEYAAFLELQKAAAADEEDLARPTRSKVQQETQTPVTPEMLYLIIRKEEINKELLNKLIREEDRKQEELLAQNQLLKQALLTK